MTEREFWKFMEEAWAKGRVKMMAGSYNGLDDPEIEKIGLYLEGHSLLPQDHDKIPERIIWEMGELLLRKTGNMKTQEAILMILAHHGSKAALSALEIYAKNADKGLDIFAGLALDECRMWAD